jgi:hypothetical protein
LTPLSGQTAAADGPADGSAVVLHSFRFRTRGAPVVSGGTARSIDA